MFKYVSFVIVKEVLSNKYNIDKSICNFCVNIKLLIEIYICFI